MSIATTPATTPVLFATVKAANPDLFALSIVDAVASTYDKESARATIARAITGAALEWAMSGNDARLKSARAALEGKGKGQAVRKSAIAAIDSVKGANKARHLSGSDMPTIDAWIGEAVTLSIAALTPAPVAPKAPKNAPSAPIVSAPALVAPGDNSAASAPAGPSTAPWADTLTVDTVIAHIAAGAFTITEMMAISKALGKATMAMPDTPAAETAAIKEDAANAEDNAAPAVAVEAAAETPAAPVVAAPALFEGMAAEVAPVVVVVAAAGKPATAGKGAGKGVRSAKVRGNAAAVR